MFHEGIQEGFHSVLNWTKANWNESINSIIQTGFYFTWERCSDLEKKKLSARKLSAGNKQFLSFIRSLCVEPDLLILDEPCANLDNEFVKKIEFFLSQEKRKKKIIMVTHDLFQAKRLADEVIFMQNGRIIEQSLKQDFLTSKNKIIRSFLDGNLL